MIYSLIYFLYLLVVWSIYRLVFHQTEMVDEMLVKPIVWLLPLFLFFLSKSQLSLRDLGIKKEGLSTSLFLSLGLGFVFLLISLYANYQKYDNRLFFSADIGASNLWVLIVLILATSLTEELVFRGYFFASFRHLMGSWRAGILVTLFWVVIHFPIIIFSSNLTFEQTILYFGVTSLYGAGALVVYVITDNLLAPILLHLMWSIPIILFR